MYSLGQIEEIKILAVKVLMVVLKNLMSLKDGR